MHNKIKLILIFTIFSVILLSGCDKKENTNNLTAVGTASKPVAIIFESPDCSACAEENPIWNKISRDTNNKKNFKFVDINIKDFKNQDIVKLFNIKSTPTIVILSTKSNPLYVQAGAQKEEELQNVLDTTLSLNKEEESKNN